MRESIKIKTVEAESGRKKFGFIRIGESPISSIRIPIWIINGAHDGPVLCLTAGIHATEYASIEAVTRLCKQLNPQKMKGGVIAIPVVNMPGFEMRAYRNPIDKLDMMFVFPPKKNGSISHQINKTILQDVIAKTNFLVDCHGGHFNEDLHPYSVFPKINKQEIDVWSENLSRISGIADIDYRTPKHDKGLILEAAKIGVPSIMSEAGGRGIIEDRDVSIHVNGVTNVMRYLGILDELLQTPPKQRLRKKKFLIAASKGGFVYKSVKPGDLILRGQKIAEIRDLQGEPLEELKSPDSGKAKIVYTDSVVNTGDPVMIGWTTKELPPFSSSKYVKI